MSECSAARRDIANGLGEFSVDNSARVALPYRLCDAVKDAKFDFEAWVEPAAASFEAKLPVPESCDPFRSENLFRFRSHRRSICFAPETVPIRDVFCIKGMEPLAADFRSTLDRMAARRSIDGSLNELDYFILKEDKLPHCLLFGEAQAEASAAATVHMRLAGDGQSLPRLPLPVVLVRLPDGVTELAAREIAGRASRSLWRKVEMLAAGGLGAYVYWYPSVPLRALNFRSDRKLALAMCEGWLSLAGRLLRAGFLPTSAYSLERGHCCDLRNAVIDGGFADLGSVVQAADIPAEEDLFIALQMTVAQLTATILHVLGKDKRRIGQFDYAANMIKHLVRERLVDACGASVDPRLVKFSAAAADLRAAADLLLPA